MRASLDLIHEWRHLIGIFRKWTVKVKHVIHFISVFHYWIRIPSQNYSTAVVSANIPNCDTVRCKAEDVLCLDFRRPLGSRTQTICWTFCCGTVCICWWSNWTWGQFWGAGVFSAAVPHCGVFIKKIDLLQVGQTAALFSRESSTSIFCEQCIQ